MSGLKFGELFILGFHGKIIPQWVKDFSKNYGLGGVLLFDYSVKNKNYTNNIGSPKELKKLTSEIAALPSNPMVFIDQEGGKVRRLKEKRGYKPLPSEKQFNLLTEKQKRATLLASFKEMKQLGISYNFAPVIDVDYNPKNPDIGLAGRSYSKNIKDVEANTLLASEIAAEVGLGLTLKHYPGIGGAKVSSHRRIMDLSDAVNDEQEELFFKLAPKTYGDAIVISHALVRQWDAENPVTTSEKGISRLRSRLTQTLLISDDMQMEGIQGFATTAQASEKSLKAGMDMITIGNNILDQESEMLALASFVKKAIDEKRLDEKQIEKSIARVRDRKNLLSQPNVTTPAISKQVGQENSGIRL